MSYLSPDRSPVSLYKSPNSLKRSLAVSLPSLNKPQREQIENFLSQDRERIRSKLRENHFQSDISNLKDQIQTEPSNQLPTSISELLSNTYPDLKLPFDLLRLVNSKINHKKPDLKHLLNLGKVPEFSSLMVSPTASRQETLNLQTWLDRTEGKFVPIFKEIIETCPLSEKLVVLKTWKAVFVLVFKEIAKQVSAHCAERGDLLKKCFEEIEKLSENSVKVIQDEFKSIFKDNEKKLQEMTQPFISEIAFLQGKVQRLEREKEKWTQNKAEMIVKTKELINYLEVLRKFEDQVKHIKGKSRYFDSYIMFFNSMAIEETIELSTLATDKFKEELFKTSKTLHQTRLKLNDLLAQLRSIEDEISDKEVKLASLNFEFEFKETLIKTKPRKPEKIVSLSESVSKKEIGSNFKLLTENEKTCCDKFFINLVVKSKDRLIKNSKVQADHIFKSLTVIYNRCSVQLNTNQSQEMQSFQFLLYKQFVKSQNRKKDEKNLKNFLSGALKFSENRRVSVFLRLLNFGGWIQKDDFSQKSFLLYLSLFLYLQNSPIGLLMFRDQANAAQYFPFARVSACLKEIEPIFSAEVYAELMVFIEKNRINDPKQVNPHGLIEVELFLEEVLEKHETMFKEIIQNFTDFFLPIGEKIDSGVFKNVLILFSDPLRKIEDVIIKETLSKDAFNLEDAVDLACRVGAGTNSLCSKALEMFHGLSDDETRNLAKGRLKVMEGNFVQEIVQNIEVMSKNALAMWMFLLENPET